LNVVNEPEVSKTTAWSYGLAVAVIAAFTVFFVFAGFFTPMKAGGIAASLLLIVVEIVMLLLLRSLYRTRYVLTDEELVIKTTKLIGGNKKIALNAINSIETTFIPLGVRLFGASLHGGYYRVPGLGSTFLAITNFHDGPLIKTKNRNYIITPKNRLDFKEVIETKKNV
jgi:membrane protein YdbS with pleckstrin-like domain